MPVPVIIFSADEIRGKIIFNALQYKGFEALLYNRTINAGSIIKDNTPSVIILDTKGFSPNELIFFRSEYPHLSDTSLIVLANPSEIDNPEFKDIKAELCKSDPLDTELIIYKVKTLLELKSEVKSQKSEETGNKESGDEEQSLEDDLKRFLDLE